MIQESGGKEASGWAPMPVPLHPRNAAYAVTHTRIFICLCGLNRTHFLLLSSRTNGQAAYSNESAEPGCGVASHICYSCYICTAQATSTRGCSKGVICEARCWNCIKQCEEEDRRWCGCSSVLSGLPN
jgi:hypothetical protein